MAKGPISKPVLTVINIACLAVTTVFVVARVIVTFTKRKHLQLPDFFIYVSYILYLIVWVCYIIAIHSTFKVYAVFNGESPPYPTITNDAGFMQRLILPAQVAFYTLLYCVKGSFLSLYQTLLQGLPKIYRKIWLGIVMLVILSWIGSLLSTFTTCSNMKAQLSEGKCGQEPGEQERIVFSLYFSYTVDVATDIAVMVLPIRLTWNLQMQRSQKIGMMVLFGSGLVCILFATLRVVQIGSRRNQHLGAPELKWLILWTVLETSIAVIVGCCPGFAVFIRGRIKSKKASGHGHKGYVQQSGEGETFKMHSRVSANRPKADHHTRLSKANSKGFWDDVHSSQEELAKGSGDMRVVVTTKISMDETRR